MRPSKEANVAAILDTVPECRVILDALEDPDFTKPHLSVVEGGLANTLDVRFRQQTMYEYPPMSGEMVFYEDPKFRVRGQDIDFVQRAAQRVIEQKGLATSLINRATGRRKAARTI
jgi:hypothetical protein